MSMLKPRNAQGYKRLGESHEIYSLSQFSSESSSANTVIFICSFQNLLQDKKFPWLKLPNLWCFLWPHQETNIPLGSCNSLIWEKEQYLLKTCITLSIAPQIIRLSCNIILQERKTPSGHCRKEKHQGFCSYS